MAMGIESYYSYPPHVSVSSFIILSFLINGGIISPSVNICLCLLSGRVMNLSSAGVTAGN